MRNLLSDIYVEMTVCWVTSLAFIKNKIMQCTHCLGAILFILVFYSGSYGYCSTINPVGDSILSSKAKNAKTNVNIKSARVKTPLSLKSSYEVESVSIVEQISITVNGNQVFVPRSVYTDLFDVKNGTLAVNKQGSVLTLCGADASESYCVQIYFDNQKVFRRTMSSGENETVTQDTKYRLVVD